MDSKSKQTSRNPGASFPTSSRQLVRSGTIANWLLLLLFLIVICCIPRRTVRNSGLAAHAWRCYVVRQHLHPGTTWTKCPTANFQRFPKSVVMSMHDRLRNRWIKFPKIGIKCNDFNDNPVIASCSAPSNRGTAGTIRGIQTTAQEALKGIPFRRV